MYLKELTIVGFKSFADKTTLRFQPGVTAIVGPNGCGKSNVSDAVRWVLGEQSAKVLRGGEMSDVIFSGTDSRKALGMAEVSLTVSDIQEQLTPIPGVSFDYNEVTVTRRVFRDGQSQYFINKVPCRLRDIQQIFWDTGIGRSAYSMMEQGKIDLVISSKPEDRRAIFEEAAGITKFKHQKKEALRKLEYVEANLVRVTDIIREVKRQIGSLQRQAGKARRYKEIHEQLKRLDCALARHKYDLLAEDIQRLSVQSGELDLQAQQSAADIESDENILSQLRHDLEALDCEIRQAEQRAYELKSEAERAQNRIQFNTERISELASQKERDAQEIAEAERKIVEQEQTLANVNRELEAFSATLATAEEHLKKQQELLRAATEKLREAESLRNEQQNTAVDMQRRMASLHNEINALESQQREETLRFERLRAERQELEAKLSNHEVRRGQFQQHLLAERQEIEVASQSKQRLEQELARALAEEAALSANLSKKQNEIASVRSRLQLLQQLQAKNRSEQEDFMSSLREAAATTDAASGSNDSEASSNEKSFDTSSILAAISQVVTSDPEFAVAVEAALGHHLQTILVRDADCAKRIRASLNGRADKAVALAPLDLAVVASGNGDASLPPGAICWAHKKVKAVEGFESIIRRLLSDVVIVPDLAAAIELHRVAAGAHDIATMNGEFVSRRGIIHFGPQGNRAFSLPIPQAHIDELTTAVGRLTQEASEMESELLKATAARSQTEIALQDAVSRLHALEVALAARDGEFAAIEKDWRETKMRLETVQWEIQRLGEQGNEEKSRCAQLQSELVAVEQQAKEADIKLADATKTVDEARVAREDYSQLVTEARVALATQQQKRDTLLAQQAPVAQRVRELRELIAARQREIEDAGRKDEQLRAEIGKWTRFIGEIEAAQETLRQSAGQLQIAREGLVTKIESQEAAIREKRKKHSEFQTQKSALEIQLAEKRMAMQNIAERVARQYQTNIDNIRSESITVTVADTGQPKKEEIGPSELAQAGLAPDWNAIEQEVAELQAKIESMGPINLEAITEYDELEQRHKFLTEQHDDLVKSQQQLMQLISKINSETRKMFSETFEKIRDNFQAVFTELFGGGKANLILADEMDPLECGIEIVAKPPGKQLQSISLLSGGERAMTAVALLFSIYMVKPSPFCLLDEIDAPLDESNINRFVKMLQRFVGQSQFVIISHNKRTIAMADVIYGVTMEEHGVSKIVSVKFTKKAQAATPATVPSVSPSATITTAVSGVISSAGATNKSNELAPAGHHEPGQEPIQNELLNEHETRRAPIAPSHPMESYEPEDESPDDAELATEIIETNPVTDADPPERKLPNKPEQDLP